MATRSRKEEKNYKKYRETDSFKGVCTFCNISPDEDQFVKETKSFQVIKNIFSYSQWDGQGVVDHLLIVPKKHTVSLGDLTAPEAVEFIELIGSYEKLGYDFSARAPKSNRKTVQHQHTHLIKLDRKTKKFLFYLKKPYIRFLR